MKSQESYSSASQVEQRAPVTVIVVDASQTRVGLDLDDWDAIILLACASEDPADWSELAAAWPRYRGADSPEFAESLRMIPTDLESAVSRLPSDQPWLVIDLKKKCVFSGQAYDEFDRDQAFGSGSGADQFRLDLHLPPWWIVHNAARSAEVLQPRRAEMNVPNPRRDVLWGPPLARDLATRMLDVMQREGLTAEISEQALYQRTVAVHRDWLMTPRVDLGGGVPRDCLHGGVDWLEKVIEGQSLKIHRKTDPAPVPCELDSSHGAPFGRGELCLYFDACREMIQAGWRWLFDNPARTSEPACLVILTEVLQQTLERWLDEPAEDGLSPASIIRVERQRISCIAPADRGQHGGDCDCPICQLSASGLFGPTIVRFDGHHLELDDEFAFSLSETRQEWEQERAWMAADNASGNEEDEEDESEDEEDFDDDFDDDFEEDDEDEGDELDRATDADGGELSSPWRSSYVADKPIPGDPRGYLSIAFRLAEIVSVLRSLGDCQPEIDLLNERFRAYHQIGEDTPRSVLHSAARTLQRTLEEVASRHPELLGRSADLQSMIDELLRRTSEETARDG